MRTKLEALKHAIQELKAGKFYKWTEMSACNCGIVAQSVTGYDSQTLHKKIHDGTMIDLWGESAVACGVSGLPINEVLQALFDAGFTKAEIQSLEQCSDGRVLAEAGIDLRKPCYQDGKRTSHKAHKKTLIKYLEAWVRLIEREQPQVKEHPSPEMTFVKHADMKEKLLLVN